MPFLLRRTRSSAGVRRRNEQGGAGNGIGYPGCREYERWAGQDGSGLKII